MEQIIDKVCIGQINLIQNIDLALKKHRKIYLYGRRTAIGELIEEVLQIYASAFPEDDMQLEVSDTQLSVNNGYYYLSDGKCRYSTERLPGAHIQMNISELTERILKKLNPYMSLMLN